MPPRLLGESKITPLSNVPLDPHNTVHHLVLGAFTLVNDARTSLLSVMFQVPPEVMRNDLKETCTAMHSRVPSISRTASEFSETENSDSTPRPRRAKSKGKGKLRPRSDTGTRAALDALERASRYGTGHVVCPTCKKKGTNFPRCKWCAQMWCSRECRLASAHRCGGAWNRNDPRSKSK
ncbi:hypothetical protein GGX14DRAFT_578514 [Mycena pura]|uniref:Uncharacterized protein n=1 Tax=Mycena pura TaxID=153505 RepID=A0AAD6UTU5_9AGAR|nr:hypothetical protein GGX14DRAFT_578514 [Mycena pura]